jgi:5-oxoprolinase (ATP-hydrolysing)
VPPFGLDGGAPGAVGREWVERADGRVEPMQGNDRVELNPGDAVVMETPAGGGYGAA